MKIKSFYLFGLSFLFFVFSCGVLKTHKDLVGNSFVFQKKERILTIHFITNDTLVVDNYFDCNIDHRFKHFTVKSRYTTKNNNIYISDVEEITFPFIEDQDCFFLSKDYRERKKRFYPGGELVNDNDATLFEFPALDKLTILNDSTLVFYKKITPSKSIGFIFKKNSNILK